jgi:DNA replication licensing factor MCM7
MGLLTETFLQATNIKQMKQQYDEQASAQDHAALEQVNALANDPGAYDRLAKSIAPEIYGHEDVKKALLLLIVSGETRVRDRLKVLH